MRLLLQLLGVFCFRFGFIGASLSPKCAFLGLFEVTISGFYFCSNLLLFVSIGLCHQLLTGNYLIVSIPRHAECISLGRDFIWLLFHRHLHCDCDLLALLVLELVEFNSRFKFAFLI